MNNKKYVLAVLKIFLQSSLFVLTLIGIVAIIPFVLDTKVINSYLFGLLASIITLAPPMIYCWSKLEALHKDVIIVHKGKPIRNKSSDDNNNENNI